MNYARIVIFSLLAVLGGWISYSNISTATLSSQIVIERDGIVNIFSGYGCFFIGVYIVLYSAKEQFRLTVNIGKINKMVLSLFFISLILSVINFSAINYQIKGYTECKDQRKLSSRYSSRTYAMSPKICDSLKAR